MSPQRVSTGESGRISKSPEGTGIGELKKMVSSNRGDDMVSERASVPQGEQVEFQFVKATQARHR